jgi:hypothetical protein
LRDLADRTTYVKKNVEPLPEPSLSRPHASAHELATALADRKPETGAAVLARRRESACENDWNRRSMPSGDRPMPVSRTANVSSTLSACGRAVTVSTTSPAR